jgi:hypothetical protein
MRQGLVNYILVCRRLKKFNKSYMNGLSEWVTHVYRHEAALKKKYILLEIGTKINEKSLKNLRHQQLCIYSINASVYKGSPALSRGHASTRLIIQFSNIYATLHILVLLHKMVSHINSKFRSSVSVQPFKLT